ETNQIEAGKKHFTFDGVFGPESTQEDVYSRSVQPLVHSFLSGLNSSILAYGQTGAGKTYTMGSNFTEHTTASEAARTLGVIPRVVEEVLDAIASQRGESLCSLEVSFLEVYNEQVRDLLRPADVPEPKKGYQFQKDDFGNYDVRGLTHVPLDSLEALARVLKLGASRRTTASTQMNATSSRSHAIFSMRLEQTPIGAEDDGSVGAPHTEAGGAAAAAAAGAPAAGSDAEDAAPALMEATGVKRVSVFRLVDLAGSERSKKTKAEGDRLREANNINQSLVTLGRCITALASRAKHVPFRQSKLTQLLSNSLGGNSATLMVACVSPADSNFEETCMTLSYAQQAASIQNTPVVNADPTSASAVQLRHANHELRNELARLYAEGAAVDSGVLGRHGIAGGAAPSPCPGRRALSRTGAATRAAAAGPGGLGLGAGMGMTGMASMPVGAMGSALSAVAAAHSAAEQMRQREELAAAGADVARLEGQLQAARAALTEMSDRGRWAVGQASSLLDENTELASQRDMWRWRYETLSGAFSKLEGAGAASAAAKAGITPAERVAEALKEAGEAAALSAMNRARAEMAALRAEQPARSGPGGATGKAAGGRRVSKRKLAAKRAAAAAARKVAAAQSEGASAQESKTGEDGGEARPLCCEDDEDVDMGGPASGCAAGSSDEEAGGDDSASAASDEEDAHGDSDDDEEEQEEDDDDDDDDDDASHADAAAGDHGEEEEAHGPTEHDVIHIKSQMELRGQLQQVSAVLHEKQQLLMAMAAASGGSGDQTGMSVGERFDKLKADFQVEMRRSEAEVTDMEEKMRALAADLEEAKKEAVRARDDAEKEAKAKAASQKDDVLKGLRAKIQTMQRGMQEAARAQKRRDRELSRIQALQGQIEGHKREKVKLEKIMREAGKKYLEERKAHEHDRAQAAKRERAQALALKRYQQELQRQGRALEAAKQRVRTLKQKDELAKSRNASARRQRAAARRGRAGHAAAAPGSQKPHAAGDPLSAALAAGPSNPLGSPDVRLPLRAASAAAGAHGHGYGQTASRAGASGRGHRDLVTDTEGLHEAVARLIERAAAEAAGSQTDIEAEDALQESLEVGDEASLVACHAAPRGVDSNCRSLVMRTIYYRIQAAGWRSVAEAAVERRAAAAKELHALVQGAAAQTQAFAAALEGEGLGGSGWIRRAAAETPLRSKARQALAGRLLSWVMAMLVQAQAALQTATGTGIAAREGLGSTASGSGNGPASRGGRAGGRLGSAAAAGATQAELQEAVERAERSLKQELWRVQCEAAAAQREDAERVAVLQVQLVQARAEAAKAAGTAWAAEAEADAEEAAEEGGASGGSAGAADLGGEGKSAPKGSGPAGAGAACGEAGKDGRVRRMASVVSENQRLRGCIAEMEAMLGSYCDKSAAEADAAREASEAVDTLLQRVGALEQQLDAERRRANAAAAAPRRLSIVSTSPAPGKGGQAGRGHAAGSRSAAAEALRSMGGRAVHRMGATAEGDDEEDDDEDDHDHDIGRGMSSSGSASALPSVSEISAHLTLAFPGMSEGEHEDDDSPMAKSDMGPPAGFRGHSRSSSGASAHGGKHGPSRLRGLILTTSERRASAVGGPGAGHAEAAAAAVAAEEQSAKLSRRDGGSPVAKRPRDSSGTALPAAASSSAAASAAAAAAAASSAGRSGGGSGAGTGSGGVVSPAAATAGSLDAAKGTTGGPDLDEEAGEARKRPRVSGGALAALATSAGSAGADTHAASTSAAAPSGAAAAAAAAASGLAAASAAADSDDSGDEFAGNGVGFEAMTSGAGLGGTGGLMGSGHPSLIEAAYAQQAAEGRALRSRRSKYVAPKGFGSTTARGAPEHGTRVEERRRDAEAMISRDPAAIAAGAAAGITVAGAGATSSSGAPGFAPARVTVALPPAASSAAPPRPPAAHGHSAAGAASSASGAQSEPESEADADGGSKARTRARSSKQARERLAKFLGEPKGSRRMSGAGIADGGEGGKGRRTRQRLAEAAPDDKENSGATDASGKAAPPTRLGRSKLLPRS
ncbi:kif4, partial [Symbiodinium sp. KB8]